MGLVDVKNAITEKTKLEVATKLDRAHAEAARIITEAEEQISRTQDAHRAKTAELIAAMERKEHAAAQFARKSILLDEKRKAIDAVFAAVRERLESMSASERTKLLESLAAQAKNTITVQRVRCASRDVSALGKLFPQASITADTTITGGFIADDSSGEVRIDFTYETILSLVRDRHLGELTQVLFA